MTQMVNDAAAHRAGMPPASSRSCSGARWRLAAWLILVIVGSFAGTFATTRWTQELLAIKRGRAASICSAQTQDRGVQRFAVRGDAIFPV